MGSFMARLTAVATDGGRMWREGTCGTQGLGTRLHQQNPCLERVNGRCGLNEDMQWFPPKDFGANPEWRGLGGQEPSRKDGLETGLQNRSPTFPIRLLFREPVRPYIGTPLHTQQQSAGRGRRSGALPWTLLPDFPPWERRQESRVGRFARAQVGSVSCTGGWRCVPVPLVARRGLNEAVIPAGAKLSHQVWEQVAREVLNGLGGATTNSPQQELSIFGDTQRVKLSSGSGWLSPSSPCSISLTGTGCRCCKYKEGLCGRR